MGVRASGAPRVNIKDLVMMTVMGQVAHPLSRASPYRVGHDGVPRVLPGPGGIVLSHRVGDRCVGLAADHVEAGVSLHNNDREVVGQRNGPNLALLTYSCVGNLARVVTGSCQGKQGTVVGKHGGIDHLIVDFPELVSRRLCIGDRIQVYSYGLGMRFLDHPEVKILNCSPRLVQSWGLRSDGGKIRVPVTHIVPAAVMGSGVGQISAVRGDYDMQLFDPEVRKRFKLETLRFGDFVAVLHSDSRFGRAFRRNSLTIGVIIHGDSTLSGHGPGVLALLVGDRSNLEPIWDRKANLAVFLKLRRPAEPKAFKPLVQVRHFRSAQKRERIFGLEPYPRSSLPFL